MKKTDGMEGGAARGMKRLEELGVSPAPWRVEERPMSSIVYEGRTTHECASVCASIGTRREADMKLITAAPDLYECLREAVISRCGGRCDWSNGWECQFPDEMCEVQRWRKALEKAGGAK